jgi:hypothetical protein
MITIENHLQFSSPLAWIGNLALNTCVTNNLYFRSHVSIISVLCYSVSMLSDSAISISIDQMILFSQGGSFLRALPHCSGSGAIRRSP